MSAVGASVQGGARPAVVSEDLARALREGRPDDFNTASPYAAALLPLLRELGWHDYSRELIEAMPHFAEQFDLIDLRNILVSLGYESSPLEGRVGALKDELYPCLFVGTNGEVFVLRERQDREVLYFDANEKAERSGNILKREGTTYVFTDSHPTHGVSKAEAGREEWFTRLLRRFRGMLVHLLAMTFVVNLVALMVPLFVMLIYDKVIAARAPDTLPYLVSGVAILLVSDLVLRLMRARLLGFVAGRLDYLIGVETFRHLVSLPPLMTERSTVAAQLSRLKQFDSVRDFFTGPNAAIVLELPFVVLFVGVIAILAGPIALVPVAMAVILLLLGLLWIPATNRRVQRSGRARTDKQRILMQTLGGRNEIKAIGGETVWWERFREVSGEAVMANHRTLIASGIMTSVVQGITTLAGVAVIGLGTLSVIAGEMTIGALIATLALIWRVLTPLQNAFLSFPKLQQTLTAMKHISQLMQLKVERHNSHFSVPASDLEGQIVVDRVSFRYAPDRDPAVLGASFVAAPGEMVAIIGNTGSGKSTLLKLIAGMYRPQAGSLTLGDLDIRQLNAMELRRALAYVPQETRFFHGTVAQNMRLNNGLATDEELRAAAQEAGVLEEILRMPKGFDTFLGDSITEHLPPGFLRALSMARAFVSPASILLLDEPGASLDEQSDHRFVEHVRRLKGKRTIIMVSHRPSHIRLADKVVLMEQGAVRYIGPPEEAIRQMLEQAK